MPLYCIECGSKYNLLFGCWCLNSHLCLCELCFNDYETYKNNYKCFVRIFDDLMCKYCNNYCIKVYNGPMEGGQDTYNGPTD